MPRHRTRLAAVVIAMVVVGVAACGPSSPDRPAVLPPPTATPATTTTMLDLPPDVPAEAVVVEAGEDIQIAIDATSEGALVVLGPGTHRSDRLVPKDGMTIEGLPGAVLNGAIPVDGFVPVGEGMWRIDGFTPDVRDHGQCIQEYTGCSLSQDLFMDNILLWQVTTMDDLVSGTWLWQGDSIFVADDPTVRAVELSVHPYAIRASSKDVTIRNLVVEMYATPAQEGAVQAQEPGEGAQGDDWVIDGVEVRLNHGAGIRAGNRTTIKNSFVHHNGQLGITGAGADGLVIEDCEIAFNNTAGFRWEWEAGGVKITNSVGVILRGNDVHDNEGPGLWGDLDNLEMLYEGNTVSENGGPGIFHEISGSALIKDNVATDNGYDKTGWVWGAGILIAASWDVEVVGNTVSGNANAITGVQQDRGTGPHGERILENLWVHDNIIEPGRGKVGVAEDVGDPGVFTDRSLRFTGNTYVNALGRTFEWRDRSLDAAAWQREGHDVDGTWIRE